MENANAQTGKNFSATKISSETAKTLRPVDVLIGIAVLGSIWGFVEVVLGGALQSTGFSQRAGLLTGLGMGIMGVALGAFRRSVMLLGIAVVAILCKELVVPILHVSILCKANSVLAVGLDGVALAGVAGIVGRRISRGYTVQIVAVACAALLARSAFYFMGMKLAPCAHLLSFNKESGYAAFMAYNALGWAAFSALFFPLGHWLGVRLREPILVLGTRRAPLYYAVSALAVALCWVVSGFAISAGF